MAPLSQPVVPGCSLSDLTHLVNASRLSLDTDTPYQAYSKIDKKSLVLSSAILAVFFSSFFLIMVMDVYQKCMAREDGRRRSFRKGFIDRMQRGFTKMSSRKGAENASANITGSRTIDRLAARPAGVLAEIDEEKMVGLVLDPMERIEVTGTPFEVPFLEGVVVDVDADHGDVVRH